MTTTPRCDAHPIRVASPAEATIEDGRALDTQERVRASLDGADLLAVATEDSCTWYGYLSVVLCRITGNTPKPASEGHRPGR